MTPTKEQKEAVLYFLLQTDIRFFYHTLSELEEIYIHVEEKCPKCIALKELGLSTGL